MRRVRLLALLLLPLLAACAPEEAGPAPLGEASRSWDRAFRRGRDRDWRFEDLDRLKGLLEAAPPAGRRALCDAAYDLADVGLEAGPALTVLQACAEALGRGASGDPLAAAVQLQARADWPADAMVQTVSLMARVQSSGGDPADLVRVLDRATVFGTPAWTALQFLKDMEISRAEVPLGAQADLFEEALGRKGRHLEAQAVLNAFREAVRGGLPAKDLSAACRRKLRIGMSPARLPAWLGEVAQWPSAPLPRPRALKLVAAGLACGLSDEEVAAFGPFIARSVLDAKDAGVLADRLEGNLRQRKLRGKALLEETLADFSGARPSEPAGR